MLNPNTPKL